MHDRIYRFGDFELDRHRFQLLRHGQPVKIERIPMELLTLLVESEGRVVSRADIVDRLWGKDVFVDTEHGINTAVRKVRTALRDDVDDPRFVQTVAGKGYRFIPAVQMVGSQAAAEPSAHPAAPAPTKRWWRIGALALAVIVVAALSATVIAKRRVAPSGIHSIAVLPLSNLSGDPAQDYFADGITDELITMLARNTPLRVISRTSVMQYKGASKPLREIARSLGADAILEGSISRTGSRVHVNVQLISGSGDSHIWAESYDRSADEVYALPSELSYTIARKLRTDSSPARQPRYVKPQAHDAYLRGREYWSGLNHLPALDYMKKAIELQPDYAAAWNGLAVTYSLAAADDQVPPREIIEKAHEAARRAQELDDTLVEVHVTLSALHLFYDWDWKKADQEIQSAMQLDPGRGEIHHLRSYLMIVLNRQEEALNEQRFASNMDPFGRPWGLGVALIRLRRFDAAIEELQRRKRDLPQNPTIRYHLADAYRYNGMQAQAAQELEQVLLLEGDTKSAMEVRQAFQKGGDQTIAEWRIRQRADPKVRDRYLSPLQMARWQARAGHRQAALKALEEAYEARAPYLIFLQTDPDFDFLHGDLRYRAIVQKMGMPPAY